MSLLEAEQSEEGVNDVIDDHGLFSAGAEEGEEANGKHV